MQSNQEDAVRVRPAVAVLVGNFGVGKSSLFQRLTGAPPPGAPPPGAARKHQGSAVLRLQNGDRVELMDTCDMERFDNKSLTASYYRDTACVLLVADVTDARSVQSLQSWRDSAAFYAPRAKMILVFNKGDSPDADGILLGSIESYRSRLDCCFSVVTSTRTGQGIDLLRERIGVACRQFRRNTLLSERRSGSQGFQLHDEQRSSTSAAAPAASGRRSGCQC